MPSLAELFIRISAIDNASRVFQRLTSQAEKLNKTLSNSAGLRQAGMNVAMFGAASLGAGAAIAYGLKSVIAPAMAAEDATRHMMSAFDVTRPAAEQAAHLAETLKMVRAVSQATGISQDQLKDSVYNAKMMMLSDAQANDVAAAAAKLAIGTTHDFASAQAAQAD